MHTKLLVLILVMASTSCRNQHEVGASNNYNLYSLNVIDSILLPKISPADYIYPPLFLDNGSIVYYSQSTDTIVVLNANYQLIRKFKLIPSSQIGVNVGMQQQNDSSLVVFFKNRSPYVDSSIIVLNINTGSRQYKYQINSENFLTISNVDYDSFNRNPQVFLYKNKLSQESNPFVAKDFILLPLIAGSDDTAYQKLYSNANSVIKVFPNHQKSEYLNISFSMANDIFQDSLPTNCLDNRYLFQPFLTKLSDDEALISFRLAENFIIYNSSDNTTKKVKAFPKFLDTTDSYFGDYETSNLSDIYLFSSPHSNSNSDLFFRQVKIPVSSKTGANSSIKRYIVYSKNADFKPIGIIDQDITQSIVSVDKDGFIYVYKKDYSDTSKNILLEKCTLRIKSTQSDKYNINLKQGQSSEQLLKDYIMSINPDLLHLDTIPILSSYASCLPCTHKLGVFLGESKNYSDGIKPFILVTSSSFGKNEYYKDYELDNIERIYNDSTNKIVNYISDVGTFGYLIKSRNGYFYNKVLTSDIDQIFNFLNPNIETLDGICIPFKKY